jgi:hypothetical protein
MFQFPGLPSVPYGFRHGCTRITACGFPHSEIPGSKVGQHLPQAYRSRPRPSSALSAKASTVCPYSLDRKEHVCVAAMEFSRCARAGARTSRKPARGPVSQNSAAIVFVEVDVLLGELRSRTARGPSTGSAPTGVKSSGFPRKEVIQPQLPLRLPCYDFTPIIDPTFDGSLPCGLGHRLRVLPTFVV